MAIQAIPDLPIARKTIVLIPRHRTIQEITIAIPHLLIIPEITATIQLLRTIRAAAAPILLLPTRAEAITAVHVPQDRPVQAEVLNPEEDNLTLRTLL